MVDLMYKTPEEIMEQLQALYNFVLGRGEENYAKWQGLIQRPEFEESAKNLSYYLALRRKDIRPIQNSLIPWGLSSLGRLESKTLSTLESVMATLGDILGKETIPHPPVDEFSAGRLTLEKNTEDLFGPSPEGYRTRIMVTMPREAADKPEFVKELISEGMNIARINCSHDDEETWLKMITNIRQGSAELGKTVKIHFDISGPKIRIEWLYTSSKKAKTSQGDRLRLTTEAAALDPKEEVELTLGTSVPQVFDSMKIGDRILFDDGRLECQVTSLDDRGALLEVVRVNGDSVRIKPEKGLNFPDTPFQLPILDDKDRQDIAFACQHADIIGCSFIRSKEDIFAIQEEIKKHLGDKTHEMPLMAKIETPAAVENLAEILVAGAGSNPFSVMIARGDLAVEIGYIRLAELQQEIAWICEAANIPVVWATEVFANLVENGVPTRAEVTDVVEGSLSECIMLNKGKYIVEAVKMLVDIFKNVEIHQYKKTPQLRALNIAKLK